MNKRILLPLKEGDKVVRCAKATTVSGRGDVGQVTNVIDNLTVQVKWEYIGGVPVLASTYGYSTTTERAYNVQKEGGCHHCVHRMRHLAGQECPRPWKEVKSIHESIEKHVEQSPGVGSVESEEASSSNPEGGSGGQSGLLPEPSN